VEGVLKKEPSTLGDRTWFFLNVGCKWIVLFDMWNDREMERSGQN